MLRSILLGLDDTPDSLRALELALDWAQRFGALLVALGVIDQERLTVGQPVPLGGAAYKAQRDAAAVDECRHKVDRLLERFSLRCAAAGVASKVLEDVGAPAERLALQAQRYDLLMLGRQTDFELSGQGDAETLLPRLLRNAPRPAVIVRDSPPLGTATLIAYDGSAAAARTLLAFAHSGLAALGEVHVLAVHDDRVEAARRADRAVEFLAGREIRASAQAVSAGNAAGVILDAAQELRAGLLVLGAFGQPVWKEFFFGSVTVSVLNRSPVPMFLYH